jgi:hypothetical protein
MAQRRTRAQEQKKIGDAEATEDFARKEVLRRINLSGELSQIQEAPQFIFSKTEGQPQSRCPSE